MFQNKTVLITGGTGSFGNAVVRRLLRTNIGEIRIFSRDEKKQEDMRLQIRDPRVRFYIGDVRDASSIGEATKKVDFLFHAAALKQVPSCEFYPMEAVRTNVLGAQNVLDVAVGNGVEKLVMLSTDKAVYPINAMGMTKALMEKLLLAKSRQLQSGDTILCTTRYGNVMASRGSVIPLFINQLKAGTDLTVTDPEMTRFLMSLEDSVDMVLHAYEHGRQGDTFVQKAPAATVGVVAEALKRIFNRPAPIRIIGTRHGEKLYETLVSREEMVRAADIGGLYQIPADGRDLDYSRYFSEGEIQVSEAQDFTSHNTRRLGVDEVVELFLALDYFQQHLRSDRSSPDLSHP